jgi:hypothetical protein
VNDYGLLLTDPRIIIPTFVELTSTDLEENKLKLAEAGVTFPIGKYTLYIFLQVDGYKLTFFF